MDVPVLDGARCEVSEIKQWWGAPGASLQETLGLRSSPEEPGRRKDLLRFADKLPRAGRKRGWAQGRGRAGDPLGEQVTVEAALCESQVLAQAHPQTLELGPRLECQIPVAGSKKVEKKQLGPGREVQLGRRLHPAA